MTGPVDSVFTAVARSTEFRLNPHTEREQGGPTGTLCGIYVANTSGALATGHDHSGSMVAVSPEVRGELQWEYRYSGGTHDGVRQVRKGEGRACDDRPALSWHQLVSMRDNVTGRRHLVSTYRMTHNYSNTKYRFHFPRFNPSP